MGSFASSSSQQKSRTTWLQLIALTALLALACSAVCLYLWGPFTGDSPRYMLLARNIAAGHGFSAATEPPYPPEAFRAPLYPYFLAAIFALHGGVPAIVAIQFVLFLVSIVLVLRLAEHFGLPLPARLLLGLIVAGHPALVRWAVSVTTESVCLLLFSCFALTLVQLLTAPRLSRGVALAFAVAALFYTRAEYLLLLPALGFAAFAARKTAVARYVVAAAGLAATLMVPWIARNLKVIPGIHPLGVGSGMTLWVRAVELAEPDIPRRNAWLEDPAFLTIHHRSDPGELVRADARLTAEAVRILRAHPVEYLIGAAGKLLFREWVEVYSPGLPRAAIWLATLGSSSLLLASYLGIYQLSRGPSKICYALVTGCFLVAATHALGGTEARYTMPLRPVLYLFAAAAIWNLLGQHLSGRMARRANSAFSRSKESS